MGLTTCPDCNHEVSTAARACPNCGRPLKVAEATQIGGQGEGCFLQTLNLGCVVVVVIVIMFIILLMSV